MGRVAKAVVQYGGKQYTLTDKQQRFVEEYCKDWNGAGAARRAGYSKNTAAETAYENLNKPHLAAAIEGRMSDLSMSSAEIQARLTSMARGSLSPFLTFEEDGVLGLDLGSERAEEHLHLVREVTVGADGSVKLKLHDPKDALDKLSRIRGLYDEKRGTDTRIGILVLPSMSPPGTVSDRQREAMVVDMEEQADGSFGAKGNGKSKANGKGLIARRKKR